MIHIKKGREPMELIRYKKEKFAYYEGMPKGVKEAVKISLLEEQGYLCAYCMRRILPDTMTIEHYNCQSDVSEQEALDYRIMLGVCLGNRGTKEHRVTKDEMICDAHRGNDPLKVNPQKASDISLIRYNGMGIIDSDDTDIEKDVDKTLNLKSLLEKIKKIIENPDEKGWKQEYSGILLYYLDKQLKKPVT